MTWRDWLPRWGSPAPPAAPAPTPVRAAEAGSSGVFGTALSADDRKNIEQGFRRLSANQGILPLRDLQPLAQERMLRLVHWLWESNPLARWLVETTVDFVLGEGASIQSPVPPVQDVLLGFWEDPVNQLDRRLDGFTRELGLNGEVVLSAFVNDVDGRVRLGYVDPLEIDQVLTDPENILVPQAVVLKSRVGGSKRVLKVIREETRRASPYFGFLMGAVPNERDPLVEASYDGSCFLFQVNKLSSGRRGRSDLLALIDWLDGYDQFLFDSMDAASLFNSFVWDVTLEGASEQQVRDFLAKNATVKRGMVRAHNEKVTWKEVAPDLKAPDKDVFARLYRGHILGALSYPEHWYGLAGEVNLASAKEMGLPPVKRLTRRQKELRYVIRDLLRFQLHQAILHDVLPLEIVQDQVDATGSTRGQSRRTDQAFSIILPELSMRDQSATVAAATSLTAALIQAQAQGWIRAETAAKLFANLVSGLGMAVNAEEELAPVSPDAAAAKDYSPQNLQRILAQLQRLSQGNGDNLNQPKGAAA